nr:sulfotransferase [Saccharopolyspora sp. HNM0983]
MHRRLTALLADRLRLRALQRAHPEIQEVRPVVAAEICGLPRTGSTLLHRLLSSSPQLTSTMSWETTYPLPFPGEGADAAERKHRAQQRQQAFLELSPDFGDLHTVAWDAPEEDVILVDRSFTSMSFESFHWVPSYGDWLRSADQSKAYAELHQWLQVLQWQQPQRSDLRWILKSPHHLTAVNTVLDTFEDCSIVMTHRSPARAVPSYASMVSNLTKQYSDTVDDAAIGRYWSERFAASLRAFTRVREARPERFVDVRFDAMLDTPVAEALRVLRSLGRTPGADDRSAFESYVERDREQRSAAHRYTPEEFGLSADQLDADFAFYQEEYL